MSIDLIKRRTISSTASRGVPAHPASKVKGPP